MSIWKARARLEGCRRIQRNVLQCIFRAMRVKKSALQYCFNTCTTLHWKCTVMKANADRIAMTALWQFKSLYAFSIVLLCIAHCALHSALYCFTYSALQWLMCAHCKLHCNGCTMAKDSTVLYIVMLTVQCTLQWQRCGRG